MNGVAIAAFTPWDAPDPYQVEMTFTVGTVIQEVLAVSFSQQLVGILWSDWQ